MQAAINLQGEQVKHDLRKEINSILVTVGRVSKRQFLEYFTDNKPEQVGYLLHQMVQTGEICEPEEGIYLQDERFLDATYYKTPKIHGSENVYADMQQYKGHLTQLQKKQQALWVFLDFKKRMQAQDPVAIDSREFPFMLLAFFADGCIYEILEILKGEESQLALLASKERYEQITGQVRRIVIVERMEQIEGLKRYQIHGIVGYVTVDIDGKTCYQHQ